MIESILLFVLLLLTALARYLVYGAFEPVMFSMIFLFPVAALVIFLISKKLADKERAYKPKDIEAWSFYNAQKSLMIRKPLFKGNERRGYVKRYFPQKWQYALGDILGYNWYLSLRIQIDQDLYDVRWYREKWFDQQDHWWIYKNGTPIGFAQTMINLKNTAKFKEAITYVIDDQTYLSSATSISSIISLSQDDDEVGTLKRNHMLSNVQVLDVVENRPECLVPLIVHSYYYKNK
ncbi:hypothetical protein [Niallia sp. Krafla_26]|uniref:hypothetical protein n=1 Tax=Niallia sp. Krafla_26 TaxID=3064703 RepID=UPI003D182B1E